MSESGIARLQELAPRMRHLDELRAERDKQRAEVAAAEKLLKQLRWNCYQAEGELQKTIDDGAGIGGFLHRLLSDHKAKVDDLAHAAEEARDVYESAKQKLKPLRAELTELEREVAELESLHPQYDSELTQRLQNAAAAASGSALAALVDRLLHLDEILGTGREILQQAARIEASLGRIDRGNLFTLRAEMGEFQRRLSGWLAVVREDTGDEALPTLPTEEEVRMLEPVGVSSNYTPPSSEISAERVALQVAMGAAGTGDLMGLTGRMRAIVSAGIASDESLRTEGRYQAMTVASWRERIGKFSEALAAVRRNLQQDAEILWQQSGHPQAK